jgi:hypothetical protein
VNTEHPLFVSENHLILCYNIAFHICVGSSRVALLLVQVNMEVNLFFTFCLVRYLIILESDAFAHHAEAFLY